MGKGTMRNHPCPCGSGKKYKKCHYLEEYKTFVKRRDELAAVIKARILEQIKGKGDGTVEKKEVFHEAKAL